MIRKRKTSRPGKPAPQPPAAGCTWIPWTAPATSAPSDVMALALEASGAKWIRCLPAPGLVCDVQTAPTAGIWSVRWIGSSEQGRIGDTSSAKSALEDAKRDALRAAASLLEGALVSVNAALAAEGT